MQVKAFNNFIIDAGYIILDGLPLMKKVYFYELTNPENG